MRHLISLTSLDDGEFADLVGRGLSFAAAGPTGLELKGRIVGTLFAISSTRTRTSFASAALRLGASVIPFGPGDLQLATGESLEDTGRILSSMIDALVLRMQAANSTLSILANQTLMACINAMSFDEHPTQAIADLITIHQQFGSADGIRILYLGEEIASPLLSPLRLPTTATPNYIYARHLCMAWRTGLFAKWVEVHCAWTRPTRSMRCLTR